MDEVPGFKSVPFPVLRGALLKVSEFFKVVGLEREVELIQVPEGREE